MQDSEIIELYFARDERAIDETATKYGAYCHKIAKNILRDIFEAEECVNDTYLRAWGAMPPTRPTRLGAFLGKIARNLAIDRYNAKRAKKRSGALVESLDELAECVGDGESDISLSELGALISRFLRGEKEMARKIFVRRYFYENTVAEIASAFGIGEGQIKSQLFRTRQKLAMFLRMEGVFI